MDSSQVATTSAVTSSYVFSKVALLDIREQHTMEPGGMERIYKEEPIEPDQALCILREDMEDISIIYKNEAFKDDSSSISAITEMELQSYSYSGSQIDSEDSELRILYFTTPNRPPIHDTPLFKLWRWFKQALCITKPRGSES